ncbi:extradiol dioxygenase [Prescottella defluvii]|nr:extradiol dioxygenase [Prescottella defluvii]
MRRMAISRAHLIVYSRDEDADRHYLRDVLGFPNVDAGGGWLIFKLPPAEAAVHPGETADDPVDELYLMGDNLDADTPRPGRARSRIRRRRPGPMGPAEPVPPPGGSQVGIYEPRHPRATDL